MGTERLPSLMAAEDSTRTWRFEIDKDLRMALGTPGIWKAVAIHRTLNVVRPTTSDNAEIGFYTGGELGTTYEHALKLETTGALNLKSYNSGAFTNALSVSPAGVVTLNAGSIVNGCTILTGTRVFDLPNIPAGTSTTFTITVTGAVAGNSYVGVSPDTSLSVGLILEAIVTSADTVTVRATNLTAGAINETSRTFRATVFQY